MYTRGGSVQNTNGNNEAIIIVDILRIQKEVRTKIVPMSCKRDLDFLCDCSLTSEHLRPWTHISVFLVSPETWMIGTRTNLQTILWTIAEDVHLILCDQICSQVQKTTKTSGHDHGTIDKVLGDTDTERAGDAPERADRGAVPPEQIPLLSQPGSSDLIRPITE